jgi:two-component system chemotaxis response regulator CheY
MSDELDFGQLRVLVIDDEPFMREILTRVLRDLGVRTVVVANDGKAALEKCKVLGTRLDLVICDLEMPVMNGFQFVAALRSSTDPVRKDVPVLIVTGHGETDYVKQAIGLGINGFVVKPISQNVVEQRIRKALATPIIDPGVAKRL